MNLKIYLAFSHELEPARICLEDFVHKLMGIYQNRGISIQFQKGDLNDFKYEKSQADIKSGEEKTMFLVLFHREADDCTVRQLNDALKSFETNRFPKIYVYIKRLMQEEEQTMALRQVKKRLSEELKYFWCNFERVDELLFHFVMQFQLAINDEANKLEIRDSKIWLGKEQVADVNYLSFIFKNQDYKWWKAKVVALENEIRYLQEAIQNLPDQNTVKSLLLNKQIELERMGKHLGEQEKVLFHTALTIIRMQNNGFSERLRLAVNLFENGDTKGANALLDLKEIQIEAEADKQSFDRVKEFSEELLEEKRGPLRARVDELKTKALLILTEWQDDDRIEEACRVYHLAVELAENRLKKEECAELLHDYAHFLHGNGFIEKAIEGYQAAIGWYYELVYEKPKVYLFHLLLEMEILGSLYSMVHKDQEAERMYESALARCNLYIEDGKEHILPRMSSVYEKLGALYDKQKLWDAAEESYLKSVKIWEELSQNGTLDCQDQLAFVYSNLGTHYSECHNVKKASEYFNKACELLALILPERQHLLPQVAELKMNMGALNAEVGRFGDAEILLTEALNIWKVVVRDLPRAFLPAMLKTKINLGQLYEDTGRIDKAKEMYTGVIDRLRLLGDEDHEVYLADLASAQTQLGCIYFKANRFRKAETILSEAQRNWQILVKKVPDVYVSQWLLSINNLGLVYTCLRHYKDAETLYNSVFMMQEVFVSLRPETHVETLLEIQNNLGQVYVETERFPDAAKIWKCVLKGKECLAKELPDKYLYEVAKTAWNLAWLHEDKLQDYNAAEIFYLRYTEIIEQLYLQRGSSFMPELRKGYAGLAKVYAYLRKSDLANEYLVHAARGEFMPGYKKSGK